ncbi:SDR family oxidoreductase [Anaerovibrio sp.]|uniref:SDR family NAD(P)-dependent oxidoreductase n=1 Tax=Anaerovibrio sp. TaxID=1872532 RepID=UPI0025C17F81|nr:SDR family oxidoreductase [Anaerovibrio sp.]
MMEDLEFHFENKNFVVVGASSGLGRRIALDLAQSGAKVLAVGRNKQRLEAVESEFPDKIFPVSLDVLNAEDGDWESILSEFVSEYGKFHGAVYTAGITGVSAIRSYDKQLAKSIVDTSLWGMINFLHMISKKKYAEKKSSYVSFASVAAHCGNKGFFAYSAAKGAVISAVRSIAKEISREGHRINSISPGWVQTEMTDGAEGAQAEGFGRYLLGIGRPEDVSGMALFLLSDAARWITGTDIVIDGGFVLGKH